MHLGWVEAVCKNFSQIVGSLGPLACLTGHFNLPLKASLGLHRRGCSCAKLGLASWEDKFPWFLLSL